MGLKARTIGSRLGAGAAWIGVIVPPITWILYQQGIGELVYVACRSGGVPIGPLVGALCAIVCVLAGWTSWAQRGSATTHAQRFLGRVGAGLALLFTLGILVVMAATIVIPPCAR